MICRNSVPLGKGITLKLGQIKLEAKGVEDGTSEIYLDWDR